MKLAWATDIHLDFVDDEGLDRFCDELLADEPEAVLISGDISVASLLNRSLTSLEERLCRPIYFVLGNHDFYGGGVAAVRQAATDITRGSRFLRWLPACGVVELTRETALVGHDGWGDGRLGAGIQSHVILNDFYVIQDLAGLLPPERHAKLAELGDEAAAYVATVLPSALAGYPHVLFLTHVPPFREACWYAGKISDDEWLPFFTCKAMGDVLREEMRARPDRRLTVLCGHTHGEGTAEILPNLRALTGTAQYGQPRLAGIVRA